MPASSLRRYALWLPAKNRPQRDRNTFIRAGANCGLSFRTAKASIDALASCGAGLKRPPASDGEAQHELLDVSVLRLDPCRNGYLAGWQITGLPVICIETPRHAKAFLKAPINKCGWSDDWRIAQMMRVTPSRPMHVNKAGTSASRPAGCPDRRIDISVCGVRLRPVEYKRASVNSVL
jgi:hypothetical protein